MFQIGIKGEVYGKCEVIEYEWLKSFVDEINMVGAVMTQIRDQRLEPNIYSPSVDSVTEWLWCRISAVHYGIHNYSESDVIDYRSAVRSILSRYEVLRSKSILQRAFDCGCRGCRDVRLLLDSASGDDSDNTRMFLNFLELGGRYE